MHNFQCVYRVQQHMPDMYTKRGIKKQ